MIDLLFQSIDDDGDNLVVDMFDRERYIQDGVDAELVYQNLINSGCQDDRFQNSDQRLDFKQFFLFPFSLFCSQTKNYFIMLSLSLISKAILSFLSYSNSSNGWIGLEGFFLPFVHHRHLVIALIRFVCLL